MRAAIGGVLSTRASRTQQENEINTRTTSKDSTCNTKASTNANITTSTRSPPPRPPLRPPLHSRDHNAMMRGSQKKGGTPLTAKSGNTNMPSYEKPTNSSRPLMPTLSAAAKSSNRPPLTPRVAGSAPTVASTPLPRRGPRASTPNNTAHEDIPTPVSAFLNNNITPRSGSRKVRVDSTNTTPTGTPNGTPLLSLSNDSFRCSQDTTMPTPGLGITGLDNREATKRPIVSFSTAGPDAGGFTRSPALAQADSKFFFASDAKPAQQPTRPLLPSKSSSTFFYANGESIPPPPPSSGGSAAGSMVGEEKSQPKFFHANGTPDLQLSPSPHFAPPRASSVVSSSSRGTSSRPGSAPQNVAPHNLRPMSPSKLNQQASAPPLRSTPTLQSAILPRPALEGRGSTSSNIVVARRPSIEATSRVVSHGRSSSMGSTGLPSRKVSGSSPIEAIPPSTPLNLVTTGLISTPEEAPEAASSIDEIASDHVQSPIKVSQTMEELNELASNARRERKVLDLEITNSSLEAINRTLEREMRKQNNELRRYRRLSRSGRLSIASTSLRTSTGTMFTVDEEFDGLALGLSDMSEEDEEEGFSSETSESMDDGSLSPSAMAESDLRHRKKDEKRLRLDLSKHQQLLIDSQKMNQSLKRCLGWTEALISEGKKALEYQVKVNDVELGGRVLAPDEVEAAEQDADNEGMSDIGARMLREARAKATTNATSTPWSSEGRDDRDSGVEVDDTHRERLAGTFESQ